MLVALADKQRTVYGPVDVILKEDFVEIKTIAWVTLDKDLAGQIYLGKNELVLRAINQSRVPTEAKLEADAAMIIQVGRCDGELEPLRGMLDTGAGISVMSVSAWRRIGSPTLSPSQLVIVEDLGEDDFLLGRTFIREFDVLIDLREKKIIIRDLDARWRLCRKETMGSFNERIKLVLDSSAVLAPGQITLCKLKLMQAANKFKHDQQKCVIPLKDMRREAVCMSAGRTLALTKGGRLAVPMLNPTDKQMTLRKGQKVAYALPAKSEVIDLNVVEANCRKERCQDCQDRKVSKVEGTVKSIASSINSETTMSSGRSFFPGKEELKQPDVLPDLSDLEDKLSTKQLERLRAVLVENTSVFAKNKADMGRCNLIEHRIDLEPDAVPHHEGARSMASWKASQANEEVRHLLSLDLIEPSYSPWACGVVMAKKKGNQLRFCCDFRFLNAKTIRDAYPLPRIDESITRLGCACYFTTLDLGSAFWQVPLREEDRPKTAFACELGLFQWKVMPFGLSNATATFQRLMSKVLMDVAQSYGNLVMCYVDDVIIATSTIDQHIDRIGEVLSCLRRAGLKCKPSKCELLKTSIKYLGRIIDGEA